MYTRKYKLRAKNPTCFVTSTNGDTLLHILVRENNAHDIQTFIEALGKDLIQEMILITNDEGKTIPDIVLNHVEKKEEEIKQSENKSSTALIQELINLKNNRDEICRILLPYIETDNFENIYTLINFSKIAEHYQLQADTHLYELAKHACDIANQVRSNIKKCSSHPRSSELYNDIWEIDNKINKNREAAIVEQETIRRSTNDYDEYLKNVLKDFLSEGIGNCGEHAYAALALTKQIVTLVIIKNGDHSNIIFDINADTPVFCDPWAGNVYPSHDMAKQLYTHRGFTYMKNGEKKFINYVVSYNPNYHFIETSTLFSYPINSIENKPSNIIDGVTDLPKIILGSFEWKIEKSFRGEFIVGLHYNDLSFITFLLLTSYGRGLLTELNLIAHIRENHLMMLLPTQVSVIRFLASSREGMLFLSDCTQLTSKITSHKSILEIIKSHRLILNTDIWQKVIIDILKTFNINAKDADGYTILQHTVPLKDSIAVRLLVEQGADINVRDTSGHTFLHNAILKNDVSMIPFLIRLGANIDIRDDDSLTPFNLLKKTQKYNKIYSDEEYRTLQKVLTSPAVEENKKIMPELIRQRRQLHNRQPIKKDRDLNTLHHRANPPH